MPTPVVVGIDRWPDRGLCRATDTPNIWFPPRRDSAEAKRAKAWCSVCPVREDCLNEALAVEEAGSDNYGIWGGLDEHERELEAIKRRREAA